MKKTKVVWCHWMSAMVKPVVDEILSPRDFQILKCSTQEELLSLISDADILVIGQTNARANKEVIEAAAKLRFIQRVGSLYERFIDIDTARKAGIQVATMSSNGTVCVAEHALMLILALSRNVIRGHDSVVSCDYIEKGLKPEHTTETYIPNADWMKLPRVMLCGKTLGIIGMGEKGVALAERARGLRMKILYYDLQRIPKSTEERLQIEYATFEKLLETADFVSIHTPLTKETENMIDARALSLMKRSAFIINCSRGGEIDEGALCKALKKGEIAGAGLDVFELEPISDDNPLLRLKNVVLTPHIASCPEAWINDPERVCTNIIRFVHGETPMNLVTWEYQPPQPFSRQTSEI